MRPFTYLLILFFTVIICFIFSFDKRIRFDRQFGSFLKASVIVAIPFILWDIYFTKIGVWWFNYDYTIGLKLIGLPLEEWLFFIFIPFSCVFTFHCLDLFFDLSWADAFSNVIVFLFTVACILMALIHHDKAYTLATTAITSGVLIYLHFFKRATWTGRATFVYLILMAGFIPVNGVLTGTGIDSPIVNYNPKEFLQIRVLTIPVEDAVYGFAQFLLNICFFKIFQAARKYGKG